MRRVLLPVGVAAAFAFAFAFAGLAGTAQAQRLDVDPKRTTSFEKPIPIRPGELIASDISDTDFRIGPQWHSEQFIFTGRGGETVALRARTNIPDFEVLFREKGYNGKVLSRGSAKEAPVTAMLPKDGTYFIVVAAKGPARIGKYLLSFGSGESLPAFGPAETSGGASTTASLWLRPITAAPLEAQATGRIGAGTVCSSKELVSQSEMRRMIEAGALDYRLRQDLASAGVAADTGGAAAVSLSGEARILSFETCLPDWGITNFDRAYGKVEIAIDWTLRDRTTGAVVTRVSTRERVDRRKGPGGLQGVTQDAFSANIKALLANPAFQEAARRPPLAKPRQEDGATRDPLLAIVPPWQPTAFGAFLILDTLPKVVESDIDATDEDIKSAREVYRIKASAGETVSIAVTEAVRPMRLTIQDSQKAVVAEAPVGLNPTLKAKLPATGEYLVTVTVTEKPRFGAYRMTLESDLRPKTPPAAKSVVAGAPKPAAAAVRPSPSTPPSRSTPPKFTPPPGVLAAEVGKTVARPAVKMVGAAVDLFAFIGEAGSVLQATAASVEAGGQVLTLHTPEGAEILSVEGVNRTTLTAVLPRDGIYLLSVGRQDAAKPYRLALSAEAPDLFQWRFRNGAGYEVLKADGSVSYSTCWTAPGWTLRYNLAGGDPISQTVQRGGAGRWEGKSFTNNFTTQLVDGVFTRTYDTGKPDTWTLDEPPPRLGAYRGYFCR